MGTNTLTRLEIELEQNKDPGIPNNFPYKDRILAEIAEQRRRVRLFSSTPFSYLMNSLTFCLSGTWVNEHVTQDEEEKQQRKEQRKAEKLKKKEEESKTKAKAKAEASDEDEDEDEEEADE